MFFRKFRLPLIVLAVIFMAASASWALGFKLSETKEQLKLDYKMSVLDHGTGRVTINLTIADQGRLKPLNSVDLVIPSKKGSRHADLWVSLATREVDGKLVVRAHLLKELAKRAEIHLTTSSLDGKQEALTWYYHAIPVAKHIKNEEQKNK